jgi:hypothetical protein
VLRRAGLDPDRGDRPDSGGFRRGRGDGAKDYAPAVIEQAARRIHAAVHPLHDRVAQQARDLLIDLDEPAGCVSFLIRDRTSASSGVVISAALAGGLSAHRLVWHPVLSGLIDEQEPAAYGVVAREGSVVGCRGWRRRVSRAVNSLARGVR